jgi:hypothetical protein
VGGIENNFQGPIKIWVNVYDSKTYLRELSGQIKRQKGDAQQFNISSKQSLTPPLSDATCPGGVDRALYV